MTMFWRGVTKAVLRSLLLGVLCFSAFQAPAFSSTSMKMGTWTHDQDDSQNNSSDDATQNSIVQSGTTISVGPMPNQVFALSEIWDSFIRARDPNGRVEWGLSWQGSSPYERESLTQKVPASVMKVFTAAAALKYLGPDFVFENYFRGYVTAQKTLVRPEFIVSGDPTWGDSTHFNETLYTRIDQVIQKLVDEKIKKVVGPILINTTNERLLNSSRPKEWKPEWVSECYAAIPTPVILNKNCAKLRVTSSGSAKWITSGVGTPIILEKYSREQGLKRTPKPQVDSLGRVFRYELTRGYATVTTSAGYDLPVQNNEEWLQNLFLSRLKKLGISYDEKPIEVDDSVIALELPLHSRPLTEILPKFLQWSINIIADRLALEIAEKRHLPTNGEPNLQVLAEVTGSIGDSVFYDGSGLVPVNFVAPKVMYSFLNGLRNEPYFEILKSSLPESGKSGTLTSRLNGPSTIGKVFAKTGTINGVANLAGYFLNAKNELEPFVVLTRSETLSATSVRSNTDKIITRLVIENSK